MTRWHCTPTHSVQEGFKLGADQTRPTLTLEKQSFVFLLRALITRVSEPSHKQTQLLDPLMGV